MGSPVQHEYDVGAGAARHLDEARELAVLAPGVHLAVPRDVLARLAPARHRREAQPAGAGSARGRPPVEDHGLARRAVREGPGGDRTPRRAEVLAERAVVRVGAEEVDREARALRDLDLREHRVRLEVDAHRHPQVLVAEHRRGRDVDEHVGAREHLRQRRVRQPEDAALARRRSVGPPLAQAALRHQAPEPGVRGDFPKVVGLWKGRLRVSAIYKETPSVKTFRLQDPDGGIIPFAFLPGQFLTYSAEIDGKTVRRSYTIASSAAQTAYVETTIKREDGGVFSDYMHDKVKEGDILDVMAPSGNFTFTGREADSVVLIGGGVGITPLMAAIRYLFDIAWPGQIHLVYGAQSTEQFIFRDELEYLQRRMNNLHVVATMARAAGTSWMGSEGQITADFMKRAIPDLAQRRVHLCGPPRMMEALRKTLGELGVPSEQIKTEAFGPARGAVPPPGMTVVEKRPSGNGADHEGATAIGPATASIRFAKSGKVVPLPPDKSVLEVAESIGVPIDYSCRSGICGLCKTHLLEGSVTMEVQEALTEDDKAKGMILACQAKSIGNLVVEA